jgi:two-component system, chemotaxis family, CheB/CheR fusion protein
MEHSEGEVVLMRRVSSRRKPKFTAAHQRAATKAQKPSVVASVAKRGPVSGFYVVGLGASAGGLEALRSFFATVPAESGAAFVVIQHLAPDHRSQMVELLATHTMVPVSEIEDGVMIQPDHVYVIPPGKYVKIFRGRLFLSDPEKRAPILPIDYFFRSLAEDRGELAIGIALSGTGSDATLGVRAIKEAGGTVMVQDEGSAKFSAMPNSAAATGLADYVLPPAEMARELLLFIRHPLVAHAKDAALKVGETTMQKIVSLIHEQTGIDFTSYKPNTVARRIQRRIGIAQVANPEDYLEFLEQSPQEVAMLGRDLLINVTRFFRDGEVFDVLRGEILPAILKRAAARKALRIWVPGCATGEEAYSIAILVQELVTARGEKWDVKIFATDVDKVSIEYAGRGLYPKSIAADVAPELLSRFFVQESGALQICSEIRKQVVFARQNILGDPPFTKVDLISCRNLLIYLRAESQKKVMALLHFALRPGGYLLLGTSEAIGDRENAFETVDAKMRIFQKRRDSSVQIEDAVSGVPIAAGSLDSGRGSASRERVSPGKKQQLKLWETISARLMAEFGTTCLVLNEKYEILHSFGEPQRFLTVQPGRASLSVLKLVPRALSLALSGALRRAAKEQQAVGYSRVPLPGRGRGRTVDLKVEPLAAESDQTGAMLVFFQEPQIALAAAKSHEFNPSSESIERIADLETELESTKEKLQAATEDEETTHQELQAANEELLAGNEELQSSNEELESVNEELTTLNTEYQQKISELIVSNNDLENFLHTSDIATIFLDAALCLRRFTPAVTRVIPLQPHDVGRPLTSFAHPLIAAIAADLPRVAAGGEASIRTVETVHGVWHLVRITSYRRQGASDCGLVVTILDVSALHRGESNSGERKLSGERDRLGRPSARGKSFNRLGPSGKPDRR